MNTSDRPDSGGARRAPSLVRLAPAALVGAMGVIVLSVAFSGYVVGSSHGLPAEVSDDARALVAATPAIAAVGLLHLLVALAFARGRDAVRLVAASVTGLVALAAGTSAAMVAAGVDPVGWSSAAHPIGAGVGTMAIAAAVYGLAALVGGIGPADGPSVERRFEIDLAAA